MRIILFETVLTGHRMEYIHHLYMGMLKHKDDKYVIAVAEEFNKRKSDYEWPVSDNISFDFIPQEKAERANKGNMIAQSWSKSKLLREYVKKHESQKVFLITLMKFLPFLPFFTPLSCKIVSIIYKIYLYEWKKYSLIRKIVEVLKYALIVNSRCIQTIFILNDEISAGYLNRLYRTSKFQYLVDPYNEINYTPNNKRYELHIPDNNKVFLHFGGLQQRKGTMEIVKALSLLNDKDRGKVTVIFAGKVYEDIRERFYIEIEKVKNSCQILVFDQFCSVEFLADLCLTSDCILIPYQVMAQSSGLLGYAAKYKKPVLGPSEGLIGKLIRKYNLGFTMPTVKAHCIAEGIIKVKSFKPDNRYINMITVETFANQIFNHL